MENITIGNVTTLITFLVTLIGGLEFLGIRLKRWIQKEIEPLKEELNKNSLNTMKNTICNENIPLSERVSVGREYIEKGGNGAVKIYVHKLEEKFENELNEKR